MTSTSSCRTRGELLLADRDCLADNSALVDTLESIFPIDFQHQRERLFEILTRLIEGISLGDRARNFLYESHVAALFRRLKHRCERLRHRQRLNAGLTHTLRTCDV